MDAVCTPALERAVAVGAAHLVAALAVVQLVGRQDATEGLIALVVKSYSSKSELVKFPIFHNLNDI